MKNATGSKSALKSPKAAKKATVAALSNELNRRLAASTEAKPGRKGKAAPPAEVPDWAKRAASRDTATEMAAVPDGTPTPATATEPPTAAPTSKKGRAPKLTKVGPKKETPAATAGSIRAIGDGWLDSLRAAGHTPSTISSYGNDLEIAYEHLGGDTAAADLTEKQIAKFNTSDLVTKKKNGKGKAMPTVLKTRRALRLALVWAEQTKLIKKAPFPAKTPA